MLELSDSVCVIKGVGDARATALAKLNIKTVRDLLYDFPRAYENRGHIRTLSEGTDGTKSAFLLTVGSTPKTVRLHGRMSMTKFKAFDDSGTVEVVYYNQEYVRQIFSPGDTVRFWGKLNYTKAWTLSSPEYELVKKNGVLPDFISTYSLSSGVNRKMLEGLITTALTARIPDFLPEEIRLRYHFPTLSRALHAVHRPGSHEELNAGMRRLIFDELFCMSVAIASNRHTDDRPTDAPCLPVDMAPFYEKLPYRLTGAQERSIREFASDMTGSGPHGAAAMHRILIGDVGSGKTVCAMAAIYLAAKNGYQTALMAPTEILATQHFHDMQPFFASLGISVALLTGSTSAKEKRSLCQRIKSSATDCQLLIGTHALLEDNIRFFRLGLTITDEQHRFGIRQRSVLDEKSEHGHLLVMSATPIPRTLALALYGDLDISRLDELPAGRIPIETFVVNESYRARLNGFIAKQVHDGGQVYIVCPAIEATDADIEGEVPLDMSLFSAPSPPLQDAVSYAEQLQSSVFPDLSVGLLHGKMKNAEKEAVMNRFFAGNIDILVSTTVIEVGVNVPNACLMVIENADRFGLSQLHQLRGRVGRGKLKSYCILVSDSSTETARRRLAVMASTTNGFEIAERDLALRGPGDFFSGACDSEMRQSGGIRLRLAKCCDDAELMNAAFAEASALVEKDPHLTLPEHAALASELTYYFNTTENEVS